MVKPTRHGCEILENTKITLALNGITVTPYLNVRIDDYHRALGKSGDYQAQPAKGL